MLHCVACLGFFLIVCHSFHMWACFLSLGIECVASAWHLSRITRAWKLSGIKEVWIATSLLICHSSSLIVHGSCTHV